MFTRHLWAVTNYLLNCTLSLRHMLHRISPQMFPNFARARARALRRALGASCLHVVHLSFLFFCCGAAVVDKKFQVLASRLFIGAELRALVGGRVGHLLEHGVGTAPSGEELRRTSTSSWTTFADNRLFIIFYNIQFGEHSRSPHFRLVGGCRPTLASPIAVQTYTCTGECSPTLGHGKGGLAFGDL